MLQLELGRECIECVLCTWIAFYKGKSERGKGIHLVFGFRSHIYFEGSHRREHLNNLHKLLT